MSLGAVAGGRITAGVGANLIGQHAHDRNQEATVYVGNLDPQVTEELVWELFIQAGPVVNVYLPKDRVTNNHQGYGFVEFRAEEDADYSIKVLNMVKLYGKAIRINKASQDKTNSSDVGANLFIGNLDPDVDEKMLHDTFSAFGVIINTPKIMRDPDTGNSKGFGFVSFDCFEASDAAIEGMGGQYLCNRQITVSYAYKKDTKGERHGTPAERLLAAQRRANQAAQSRPHTLFATGPQQQPQHIPESQQNFGMQQPAAAPQAPLPAVPAAAAALPPVPQMPQMPPPPMAAVPPPWHMQPPVAPHGYYPGPVPQGMPPPPPWAMQGMPPPGPYGAPGFPPAMPNPYGPPPGAVPHGVPPPWMRAPPPYGAVPPPHQ